MSTFPSVMTSSGHTSVVLGILALLLGVVAILAPTVAGLSMVMLLGLLVTGAGILRMVWALAASSLGKGLLAFGLGTLTVICGLILLASPGIAATALTMVLAVYFVV